MVDGPRRGRLDLFPSTQGDYILEDFIYQLLNCTLVARSQIDSQSVQDGGPTLSIGHRRNIIMFAGNTVKYVG